LPSKYRIHPSKRGGGAVFQKEVFITPLLISMEALLVKESVNPPHSRWGYLN
jgi:hypothetical protein